MKLVVLFSLLLFNLFCRAQNIETIYFLPGQGSDERIFDSLEIEGKYKISYLKYDTISKSLPLNELAYELSSAIDTTENFALIGVSLGGMLSVELSEILHPKKVIIISSAKNTKELPFRYRFQKAIPLYAVFPAKVVYWGAKTLQPIVEPDRNTNEDTFKNMLEKKEPKYLKHTAGMIIRWNRKSNSKEIIHIHGDNDHTIPLRRIENPDYVIENGSHMMVLTRAKEIGVILNSILN